jgi:comEA protein
MIYLTRQEQRIVILLCALMLLSIGILIVKRFQPGWFLRVSIGTPDFDASQTPPQLKSQYPVQIDRQANQKKAEPLPVKNTTQTSQQQISQSSIPNSKKPVVEGKININTANIEELVKLPGIGPKKAQSIIDYRNKNGKFSTVDDILNVEGIGEKTLEKLRNYITVGDSK